MNVTSHGAAVRPSELDPLVSRLQRDGFLILPNAVEASLLDSLYDDLKPEFAAAHYGTGPFYGETTKRFGRLFARSRHAEAFARHPLILPIVEQILVPWCETIQINLTQAIEIFPGAPPQFPHRDQDMWRADKGRQEYMVNVMWALDDFTAENGATRLWPGSNHAAPDSMLPEEEAIKAVMPRGSAAIFLGSTQHAGGANVSGHSRRGMIISYCQAWLKPWENQWLAYPPEIARTFSPELAALIGYRQLAPTLGNFEGQCPSVLLREDAPRHLSFTDLLTDEQQQHVRDYQAGHAALHQAA
jgi:ectoine hydroxylase-related dioxygenase (phytanoyl-CoA dioxygenase family)